MKVVKKLNELLQKLKKVLSQNFTKHHFEYWGNLDKKDMNKLNEKLKEFLIKR